MNARRPATKGGINWPALSFMLALSFGVLNGVWAYFLFNSTIVSEVAVLKQQVEDLRENQRELLRERRERRE